MLQALKQLATLLHRYTLGWCTRTKPRRVGPASPRAQAHQSKNKKRPPRGQRLHIESLEDRRVFAAGFAEFLDPNPAPGNQFGASVVPLSTGNVVITSPYDDAGGPDAGARVRGRRAHVLQEPRQPVRPHLRRQTRCRPLRFLYR